MSRKVLLTGISLLFLMVAIYLCFGKVTKDNMKENAVYDTVFGEAIHLGMRKSNVDKIWGMPTKRGDYFDYDGIEVGYRDGRVDAIMVMWTLNGGRWITKQGIAVGSTAEDLLQAYGEPVETIGDEILLMADYEFTYKFTDANNYTVKFFITLGEVQSILIY